MNNNNLREAALLKMFKNINKVIYQKIMNLTFLNLPANHWKPLLYQSFQLYQIFTIRLTNFQLHLVHTCINNRKYLMKSEDEQQFLVLNLFMSIPKNISLEEKLHQDIFQMKKLSNLTPLFNIKINQSIASKYAKEYFLSKHKYLNGIILKKFYFRGKQLQKLKSQILKLNRQGITQKHELLIYEKLLSQKEVYSSLEIKVDIQCESNLPKTFLEYEKHCSLSPKNQQFEPEILQKNKNYEQQKEDLEQILRVHTLGHFLTPINKQEKRRNYSENFPQQNIREQLNQNKKYSPESRHRSKKFSKIVQQQKRVKIQEESKIHTQMDINIHQQNENEWNLDIISEGFFSDGCLTEYQEYSESPNTKDVTIEDFTFIRQLGKGAFGKVWLVQRKKTLDYYAMKIIDCLDEKNKANFQNIVQESKIYDIVTGDYIVKALFKFQNQNYMCFVMEYLYGGDFAHILDDCGRFSEKIAKFYLAEIVLAIEHLHNLQIVHRDLKPENILLSKTGHIKLTDFGLSSIGKLNQFQNSNSSSQQKIQQQNERAQRTSQISQIDSPRHKNQYRIIGTPDYIAPEIILHSNLQILLSTQIDIWSLGIIAFEFLIGVPPFNDVSIEKIFANIVNLNIPWDEIPVDEQDENSISSVAKDFISKLLVQNPEERLTIHEIKNHPFFNGIHWDKLLQTTPPIIPQEMNSPKQASNEQLPLNLPFNNFSTAISNNQNQQLQKLQSSALGQKVRYDLLDLENQLQANIYSIASNQGTQQNENFKEQIKINFPPQFFEEMLDKRNI